MRMITPDPTTRRRRQRESEKQHRESRRENKNNNQRAQSPGGAEERGEGVQARAPIQNSQYLHKTGQRKAHRSALAAHRLVLRKTRGRHRRGRRKRRRVKHRPKRTKFQHRLQDEVDETGEQEGLITSPMEANMMTSARHSLTRARLVGSLEHERARHHGKRCLPRHSRTTQLRKQGRSAVGGRRWTGGIPRVDEHCSRSRATGQRLRGSRLRRTNLQMRVAQ